MDLIRFRLEQPYDAPEVRIDVNGTPLELLAREVESPCAAAEGNPALAGSYAGLSPLQIGGPSHFLGEPRATWFEDGDTVLLGCTCGDWGCWPLTAVVTVDEGVVRWEGFRTGHRNWDLSALGPFVFDRAQYESALAALDLPGEVERARREHSSTLRSAPSAGRAGRPAR